jgi:N-acetylglutamate synthase-like GNAT family acetyltransferase
MAIDVRPVLEADLSRITDLLAQLGYPATTGQVRGRLDRWLADPYGMLLVAEVDGAVAGVAALHAITLLEHDGRLGRLVALVVDEAYQGHGVCGRSARFLKSLTE